MDVSSKVFLKKKFMQYYASHAVAAPKEIERREFGVGTLTEKIKTRHKSFKTERDLQGFLKREAPYYISYSSAFYDFPQNPMNEKVWRGAELIFDLDVPMALPEHSKLEKVKKEALTLIDYLKNDFGVPENELEVNFSGSKGYHIHVTSDKARSLGREERREIVDYLTGKIDFKNFLHLGGHVSSGDARGTVIIAGDQDAWGPKKGDGGWPGRIWQGLYDFVNNASEGDWQEIPGIGEKKAKNILDKKERILADLELGRYNLMPPEVVRIEIYYAGKSGDPNIKGGGYSRIGAVESKLIQKIIDVKAIHMEAEDTDKMVTIDTSRLIRLPDTIHGGSGLVARKVAGNLEDFDPLQNALAFGKDPMRIRLREAVAQFDLGGGKLGPFDPGVIEVPEHAAMHLLLKDKADVLQ